MKRLLGLFFELTALKKGPQDIPVNSSVIQIVAGAYLVINLTILQLNNDWGVAALQILVDLLLMVVFTWPLLYFSGWTNRLQQTLLALMGADAVINFFALPALASLNHQPTDLGFFAMLLLMLWHWLVIGHIYRHALERPLFMALGLAFLYLLLSSQLMEALFPVTTLEQG